MARFDGVIAKRFDVVRISGDERICVCPYHHDTQDSPNLSVNAVSGLWHCWNCGASGSLKSFQNRPEASLTALQHKLRVKAPTEMTRAYPEAWLSRFDHPTDYWTGR